MDELFSNMIFNLVYKDKMKTVTVPRTKQVSFLKTKAYSCFGPLKHKIILMYKNKELTPYEDRDIQVIFKRMRQANIMIVDSATSKLIMSRSLEKSRSANKMNISNQYEELPQIANETHQVKRYQTKCSECQYQKINFYCRDCSLFLCKYCRMKEGSTHYSHRTVTLYPEDLNKSATLYKEVVNGMLHDAKTTQHKLRGTKQRKLNIPEMQEKLLKKFENLMYLTHAMKEDYPSFNHISSNKEVFENQVDNALDKVQNEEQAVMAMEKFDEINGKEKEVGHLLQIGNNIQKFEKLNQKIEGIMKSFENKLDKMITNATNDANNLNHNIE